MRLLGARAYAGANIFCRRPVIDMLLDLEEQGGRDSRAYDGLKERLLACLPGLGEHYCGLGVPGGFKQRLDEGTYLGHIVEHVALELQTRAGLDVRYGKTRRVSPSPRVYRIVFECVVPEAGLAAGEEAVRLVSAAVQGRHPEAVPAVDRVRAQVQRHGLGLSTGAIAMAARERGIAVLRLDRDCLLQLGYGVHSRRVQASLPDSTSCLSVDIARDKPVAKGLLAAAGIPVPEGGLVETEEEALALARDLGGAVVVKPFDGNQGRGVSLELEEPDQIREALSLAFQHSPRVIVERHIPGRHYRVLVVGGRAVAASERIPPFVTGDGRATIARLIDELNSDPLRGEDHELPLTRVKVDPVVRLTLHKQGCALDTVPAAGRRVFLRQNANLSTGGTAVDVTDAIHPDNAAVAELATAVIGLDVAGVDLVTPDIARPVTVDQGALIEVNAAPGLRMHLYPSQGRRREVGRAIVDYLFPAGTPSCIPLVAVTGTNGKTTVARMIAHLLRAWGMRVGLTTTDGTFIDGRLVAPGDNAGPEGSKMVLQHREIDAAVLETARGGLIRHGLGFDQCRIGVALNIGPDHLGQDGIDSLEDLAWVKGAVVAAVSPTGHAVLNADDPFTLGMARQCRGEAILFSLHGDSVSVKKHTDAGGRAVVLRRGSLCAVDRNGAARLLSLAEAPCCHSGMAAFNVQNVAAAVAAGLALGLPVRTMARSLGRFAESSADNPGRLEIRPLGDGFVALDYGHNAAAFTAVLRAARGLWPHRAITAVVGVPGDRNDEVIINAGRAAAGFDHVIVKEDLDLRGRRPGEVAALLRRGLEDGGMTPERVMEILDEEQAVRHALDTCGSGGVVVAFYEKYGRVAAVLEQASTGPADAHRQGVAATCEATKETAAQETAGG